MYLNSWREDHSLLPETYGVAGGYGSWCLLQTTRPATPIEGYNNGKYLKNGAWMRGTSDDLLHHSGEELAQARDAAKEAALEASCQEVAEELSTEGYDVGDRVYAEGRCPGGSTAWYVAIVTGKRKRCE